MTKLDGINKFHHPSSIKPPKERVKKVYRVTDNLVDSYSSPYAEATAYVIALSEEDVHEWLATTSKWKNEVATIKDEDLPLHFKISEYDVVEYLPLP